MRKFVRMVTVAWGTQGLVSRIILLPVEIHGIGDESLWILYFIFQGLYIRKKIARKVTVAWKTLGLVSTIILILEEIHRTGCNYNNLRDRG